MPPAALKDHANCKQRLLSLIFASLLGCLLMAALTLPASPVGINAADTQQYDRASGPLGEWLADELRNRPSLRTKTWHPAEPVEWPDIGDPLALLRTLAAGRSEPAAWPEAGPATDRLRLALHTLISPRGPPA